jgi:hypothetical protein
MLVCCRDVAITMLSSSRAASRQVSFSKTKAERTTGRRRLRENGDAGGGDEHDRDDSDRVKIRKIGSLGRIIASSHAVQPVVAEPSADGRYKAGVIFSAIVNAFNTCDLDALSKLVRLHLHPQCELQSSSLDESVVGRKYIMMFWALQMETYPDGIYVCSKSTVRGMSIERDYKFTGTRVFRRPTKQLYRHVRKQANLLDNQRSSYNLDELTNILESCWLTSPHEVGATSKPYLPSAELATLFAVNPEMAVSTTPAAVAGAACMVHDDDELVQSSRSYALPPPPPSARHLSSASSQAAMIDESVTMNGEENMSRVSVASSFTTANVLALALRESGSVVNSLKVLTFTFNDSNQIMRISVSGDV